MSSMQKVFGADDKEGNVLGGDPFRTESRLMSPGGPSAEPSKKEEDPGVNDEDSEKTPAESGMEKVTVPNIVGSPAYKGRAPFGEDPEAIKFCAEMAEATAQSEKTYHLENAIAGASETGGDAKGMASGQEAEDGPPEKKAKLAEPKPKALLKRLNSDSYWKEEIIVVEESQESVGSLFSQSSQQEENETQAPAEEPNEKKP
jgi:hypothetical protein